MRDIFRQRRMWRRRASSRLLRRRDHRRRLARPRHRLLPARSTASRNVAVLEKRYIGSGAAGPQHDDPALELQDARGRALLRREREALRGSRRRSSNFNLLFSQCGHLTLAHSDRAMFVMANRAEVNRLQRDRLAPDLPRRDQAPGAGDAGRQPRRHLSDHGRAVSPARRDHPPRRGGLGLRARRRPGRRGDPPVHRGDRASSAQRPGQPVRTNRGHDQRRHGAQLHRRLEHADLRHGRRAAADHHPHPPGLRDRAGQAAARRRDRLLADARLHQPDRPRRVPDGRRDRAVDDLPDAGHAQLPPGGLPGTRSSCSRSSSGRGCCAAGPGSATSAPTTARSSARPRSRASM